MARRGRNPTILNDLTKEVVESLLDYDPDTGVFKWKIDAKTNNPGCVAGGPKINGIRIGIFGKRYLAHRLAWLITYGKWPDGILDHKNGNPFDNRISNIREATYQQNMFNKSPGRNNTTGVAGVYFNRKRGKWVAQIRINGKPTYLGGFDSIQEASAVHKEASIKYHGEFSFYNRKEASHG